jgi:hypothetical protein
VSGPSGDQPDDIGQAAYDVHRTLHEGKVGVLTLAPEKGLGVRDAGEAADVPDPEEPNDHVT